MGKNYLVFMPQVGEVERLYNATDMGKGSLIVYAQDIFFRDSLREVAFRFVELHI
jgi:hypothetical protein